MVLQRMKVTWSNWDQIYERTMVNPDDVMDFVRQLHLASPTPPSMVEIYDETTYAAIAIGVGGHNRETVVTFQASLDPPYFISAGDRLRGGVVSYCYGQELSEYLANNLVPWDAGLAAVEEFLRTGKHPRCIEWERL